MPRLAGYVRRALAITLTATLGACGPSRSASPTPPCPPADALPPDWKRAAFPDAGASIRVPPVYLLALPPPVEADGRAFHAAEFYNGINPQDTTPPWMCTPGRRSSECEDSSTRCVMTVEARPVYLEAVVLDSGSTQGLTPIYGTTDYEFRAYLVSAAWRTGPARWQVIRGHSRDVAGQQEMLSALQSLSFGAPQ
jgi:hypothetical protein